jgi:plastocyanin
MVMNVGARRSAAMLLVAGVWIVLAPTALATRATSTATAATKVNIVAMGGTCTSFFCFRPPVVSIVNNSKVVWSNQTGVTHTVTRCTPAACSGHGGGTGTDAGFGTGVNGLASGQRYGFTFDAPGTYVYYCTIHGYSVMHGTVKVH